MGGSRSGTSVEGISCSSEGCVHAELAFSYSPDRLDDACREASGWHTCMPPVSLTGLRRNHTYKEVLATGGATIPATLPQLPKVFQIWFQKKKTRNSEKYTKHKYHIYRRRRNRQRDL